MFILLVWGAAYLGSIAKFRKGETSEILALAAKNEQSIRFAFIAPSITIAAVFVVLVLTKPSVGDFQFELRDVVNVDRYSRKDFATFTIYCSETGRSHQPPYASYNFYLAVLGQFFSKDKITEFLVPGATEKEDISLFFCSDNR